MKKSHLNVIIAIMAMGIAGNVLAQRPVGDTVRGVEETYFYNHYTNPDNWSDQYAGVNQYSWLVRYDIGIPNCVPEFSFWMEHRNGNGIDGMQMFTEKPIKILGIAAVAFMQRWFDTTTSLNMSMYHRPGLPEYNSELNPGFFFPKHTGHYCCRTGDRLLDSV